VRDYKILRCKAKMTVRLQISKSNKTQIKRKKKRKEKKLETILDQASPSPVDTGVEGASEAGERLGVVD